METIKSLIVEIKEVKINHFNYCSFIIFDLFEEIENQIIINTFLNNLSNDDKVEEDEIITNIVDTPIIEQPIEEEEMYAYQWGTSEIYKIVAPLNETHFKIEKYCRLQYEKTF